MSTMTTRALPCDVRFPVINEEDIGLEANNQINTLPWGLFACQWFISGLFSMNQEYAKLIEKMIANNYPFLGIDGGIKYSLFHDPDPSIAATTGRKTNVITVNTSFIQEESASGRPYVIEYFVIHEMRHVYQQQQIEKHEVGSNDCGPMFIQRRLGQSTLRPGL